MTAVALLVLASGGVAVRAQETTHALTCLGSETGGAINFEARWGSDDAWEAMSVEPGEWVSLSWTYATPGENTSPQLQVRFDADMTDGADWVVMDLDSYAASAGDCEQEGMTYDFYLDGEFLALVGEDETPPEGPVAAADGETGFVLTFVPPEDEDAALIHEVLVADGSIQAHVDMLNEMLVLPARVPITFAHTGRAVFYNLDTREIEVDYQTEVNELKSVMTHRPGASDEAIVKFIVANAEYALFHEVGHALIHLLELPVLGREEDAVDTLSVVITLDILEDPQSVLSEAELWRIGAENQSITRARLASEHSLSGQRYALMVCMVYGSDPESFAHIAEEEGFDARRRLLCKADYEKTLASWETVLEPHMR